VPICLQMVFEYSATEAGLSLAPLSLTMCGVAVLMGRRAGRQRNAVVIRVGFALLALGVAALIPIVPRADSGWWLVIPLIVAGGGFGLLASQIHNSTLHPLLD